MAGANFHYRPVGNKQTTLVSFATIFKTTQQYITTEIYNTRWQHYYGISQSLM
jgi:hypothetical protein